MIRMILFVLVLAVVGSFSTPGYAQIDDSPDKPEERALAPEGVEPVIPLNKADPTYDLWQ